MNHCEECGTWAVLNENKRCGWCRVINEDKINSLQEKIDFLKESRKKTLNELDNIKISIFANGPCWDSPYCPHCMIKDLIKRIIKENYFI